MVIDSQKGRKVPCRWKTGLAARIITIRTCLKTNSGGHVEKGCKEGRRIWARSETTHPSLRKIEPMRVLREGNGKQGGACFKGGEGKLHELLSSNEATGWKEQA